MISPNTLTLSNQPLLKGNTQVLPFEDPAECRVFLDQKLSNCYNLDIQTKKERKVKNIFKMAEKIVKTFEYQGFEDLTLEDLRHIAVETGQPFGVVAMLVYERAYYD